LYLNFLVSVSLLVYVYLSRVKVFLNKADSFEKDYNNFIEVFFNFYRLTNQQTGIKVDQSKFQKIRQKLLKEIDLFFFLFYTYRRLNKVLMMKDFGITDKEFFEWLFYDETKNTKYKTVIKDFIQYLDNYIYSTDFSTTEKVLLNLILPADLLSKYFFD
jgi:hypothetical protein